jgi:hypothetical protein
LKSKISVVKITTFLLIFLTSQTLFGQTLRNFKTKNSENTTERTYMLDLLRAEVRASINQEVVFVVNHFMVSGNYAWMEGDVQRKDGTRPRMPHDAMDCCHVEALYKKVNGKWVLKEHGAFSTDVWYSCLYNRYSGIDTRIFSPDSRSMIICD